MSKRYEGEIFKATMFLVLCNRLVSIASRLLRKPATGGCTMGVGIFSCLDRFDHADDVLKNPKPQPFSRKVCRTFLNFQFPTCQFLLQVLSQLSCPYEATLPELSSQVYALIMIMVKGESWRMQAIVWKYLVVSFSNMCRGS